ncbi:MAG: 3-methyl-2-oxobutanoate hydroxymethyltransferase [Flammeovirgaceae bacterium]|nr:MAG: 3-methyl-2-oxobutanoate hydroxymethyltransferase [Flammeovirgaceae bacterium]
MTNMLDFKKKKQSGSPITVVTCYDYGSARIISETSIDAVLVGDSVAMVVHGFPSTVHAEVDMMAYHTAAVHRGLTGKFLIADLPFLAHRKGIRYLMQSIDKLMKAGAQAVKIEGADGMLDTIEYVVKSGIPVMGHLGLTPQSYHQLGGFRLQGAEEVSAKQMEWYAKKLEDAGVFSLVLEMVPAALAARITNTLSVPTIGIGAGPHTSGQVLVCQDLLGLTKNFEPKFLKKYLNGFELLKGALQQFDEEVKQKRFPTDQHSY